MKRFFYRTIVLLLSSATLSSGLLAADLTDRLILRNKLNLATQEIRPFLNSRKVRFRLNRIITHPENREFLRTCQDFMVDVIRAENLLAPSCYYLRLDGPRAEDRKSIFKFIRRYLLELEVAVRELTEDPRYTEDYRYKAKAIARVFDLPIMDLYQSCFEDSRMLNFPSAPTKEMFAKTHNCLRDRLPHVSLGNGKKIHFMDFILSEAFPNHPGHAVSETGWIPGNRVEYFNTNDYSSKTQEKLAEDFHIIEELYPLDGDGSLEEMLEHDHEDVFTEKQGFLPANRHPVWSQKSGVFHEIIETLNKAEESIFINIFFMGGTMGASLAKHLIHLVETKPNLKVFMIRDIYNHFGFKAQMMPVYNFLKAYSIKHPERFIITKAFVEMRRSGLPKMTSLLMTENFLKGTHLQNHLKYYGGIKADHSKVIVVDGKSDHPVAIVGSKNWLDSSGALCYDEISRVTGPAAAVVLDDYYMDMLYALMNDPYADEKSDNFRKTKKIRQKGEVVPYLELVAKKGWAQDDYNRYASAQDLAANVLRKFYDVLERDGDGTTKTFERFAKKIDVPDQGYIKLRTGFNNFDSTRANAIDQDIQAILMAKKNIYIADQFLFDRNVVKALVTAQRRAKRRGQPLDIRVILEPVPVDNGFPNILYIEEMLEEDIIIRLKNTRRSDLIGQEFHMKTISVDGEYLISGSANKDFFTMYGSFREEQLDIYSPDVTAIHDKLFLERWESSGLDNLKTKELEFEVAPTYVEHNFPVPALFQKYKGIDGKEMTADDYVRYVKKMFSILYDAQWF